MFNWFFGKKEVKRVEEETKKGFGSVKKDLSAASRWLKFLNEEKNAQKKEIDEIKATLSSMQDEIEGIKNVLSIMNDLKPKNLKKIQDQLFTKQTAVYPVQTAVQTAVQTPNLDNFSITERAILWVLLNTEMKLSYDDISAVLGKERSTIRGQINSIKQKNTELIEEIIEKNGKKRVFIPNLIKERLLKKQKVRVKRQEKD